jgi:hypothetical protein
MPGERLRGMKTRVAIGFLWTYFAWYGWSMYAGLAGINVLWGPVVVLAAVAMIAAIHVVQHGGEAAAETGSTQAAGRPTLSNPDPA